MRGTKVKRLARERHHHLRNTVWKHNMNPDAELFNSGYGHRPKSKWGDGSIMSPYAEGDVVYIPAESPAVTSGRIDHRTDSAASGVYRVVAAFSISDGDDWYFRVAPYGDYESCSDRLHVIRDRMDFTKGWELLVSADPQGVRPRNWFHADWAFALV